MCASASAPSCRGRLRNGIARTTRPATRSPPCSPGTGARSAAIAAVRASGAALPTKPAFEFLALTAARSGEVRLAVWAEIDAAAGVWVVPGQRMKSGREHRIPLTARARAILDEARA